MRSKQFCVLTATEDLTLVKCILPDGLGCCPFLSGGYVAAIYFLMYFLLFVGVLCLTLFCYVLLCVHSSFAIILKRRLVALLLLSYICIVTINVLWLFLAVHWVGPQCVIVVFPDHTHLGLEAFEPM